MPVSLQDNFKAIAPKLLAANQSGGFQANKAKRLAETPNADTVLGTGQIGNLSATQQANTPSNARLLNPPPNPNVVSAGSVSTTGAGTLPQNPPAAATPSPTAASTNNNLGGNFGNAFIEGGQFAGQGIKQLEQAGITDVKAFEEYARANGGRDKNPDFNTLVNNFKAANPAPAAAPPAPPPPLPQSDNISTLGQSGQQTASLGGAQTGAGAEKVNNAVSNLENQNDQFNTFLGELNQERPGNQANTQKAGDSSFDYMTKGWLANVNPDYLANIAGEQMKRDDLIGQRLSNTGDIGSQHAARGEDVNAYFANELGMPVSGATETAQAKLQAERDKVGTGMYLDSMNQANQQYIDERNRLSGLGSANANTSANLTNTFGDYALGADQVGNQARGIQADVNKAIGGFGQGEEQIGAGNIKTGLDAQGNAIDLGLGSAGLSGQLQMADEIMSNQVRQMILDNMTRKGMNTKNSKYIDQMMAAFGF